MNVFGGLSANLTFMSFDATYIMGDKYTMNANLVCKTQGNYSNSFIQIIFMWYKRS